MAAIDYDVIVVGGGGAGLAAALTAADADRSVLLIESDVRLGGSTALSGGVVYAAGTSVQREAGIEDDPQAMLRFYLALNQYRLNPGLIRRLCEGAAPTLEWLIALGVRFPVERLYVAGVDGVKRGHRAEGRGAEIAQVLEGHVSGRPKITVAVNTRAERLIVEDRRVAGIAVGDDVVRARAVVVASGGFGASPEMVARFLPQTAVYGDWVWYVGSQHHRGDGTRMGEAIGADLATMGDLTTLLTPGFGRDFEPYIPGWFMFVGHDGRRFADETIDYSVSGMLLREQPAGECFAIFDETARGGGEVKRAKGGEIYTPPSWAPDRLAERAASGAIVQADTLDALAEHVGIDRARFATTVNDYNRDCDDGVDRAFAKDPALLRPIRQPPFHAVRIRPAVIGITGGGLRIDRDARVLDRADRPIPGLFAAGETTGGIHGRCYVGGGGSLASALVFGRIAGASAATHVAANTDDAEIEEARSEPWTREKI